MKKKTSLRKSTSHRPGSFWRVLAQGPNGRRLEVESDAEGAWVEGKRLTYYDPPDFDELVVDEWLHVERMNTRQWWMRISGVDPDGDVVLGITVDRYGRAKLITVEREPSGDNWKWAPKAKQ